MHIYMWMYAYIHIYITYILLIRLLSLSVYMFNKTGSAETKENHFKIIDKLLLASMLKLLHQVNGIIYHYQCPHNNCPSSYIGESGRTLGDRIKEHFKAPSPIHLHSSTTGHPMDPNQFSIVHKEVNSQPRTIKEAMYIQVQDPLSTGI